MRTVICNVGKLDHLTSPFVHDLYCDSELVIDRTLSVNIDECNISVNVIYFADSDPYAVIHFSWQVLRQECFYFRDWNDLLNSN